MGLSAKSCGVHLNVSALIHGLIKENTVNIVSAKIIVLTQKLWLFFTDINTNGITFTHPEAYLKQSYLSHVRTDEENVIKSIFEQQLLLNLRTYDTTSLILYANDHLNNFIHIYLLDGNKIIYLFNYDNEIYNITVDYPQLNSSKSIQLAIQREENQTVLHVNDRNGTVPIGVSLLQNYSNKPWLNPEDGK